MNPPHQNSEHGSKIDLGVSAMAVVTLVLRTFPTHVESGCKESSSFTRFSFHSSIDDCHVSTLAHP
jgi:hypothetical protein